MDMVHAAEPAVGQREILQSLRIVPEQFTAHSIDRDRVKAGQNQANILVSSREAIYSGSCFGFHLTGYSHDLSGPGIFGG